MGTFFSCLDSTDKDSKKNIEATKTKTKAAEPSQQDVTILKLKTAQDKMLAQKKNLQKNADKCAEEAKQFIAEKKKERAIFALKRQKLYEQYLQEAEEKYFVIQKSIQDLESAIMTSKHIELLKETNDLIKHIESANGLEQLQDIAADMKEREQRTKEFNALFNENDIEDEELDQLYSKFEGQVVSEKISLVNKSKVNVNANIQQNNSKVAESTSNKKQVEQEPDELDKELEGAMLA